MGWKMTGKTKKIGELVIEYSAGDIPENEVSFCKLISGDLENYKVSKDFSKLFIREQKGDKN